MPQSIEDALQMAVVNNPGYQATLTDVSAGRSNVEVSRSRYLPRLSLEVEGAQFDQIDAETGRRYDLRVMAYMRWNLYSGGADTAAPRAIAAICVVTWPSTQDCVGMP
jgi:adhesin transport system outer membrane protein